MLVASALILVAPQIASELPVSPVPPPDIVVTGERISRTRQQTASSVSIFDADDLERLGGADRLDSLLTMTPNVQVGTGGEGATVRGQDSTGVLRDLPAFIGGTRPRTTLQIDGRPADYFEYVFGLASLWDVERVELFRSTQTITQGRNAIAGAIFVATADPSFDLGARVRAIGSTEGRRQLSASGTGPLSDSLALRVALDWGRDRPASRIVDSQVGADPNIDKQEVVRFKLLAEPSPALRVVTGFTHSHSQAPQIVGLRAPFRARRDPAATYGVFGTWIDALTLNSEARLASGLDSTTTLTFTRSRFERFAPQGLGQAKVWKSILTAETVLNWRPSDGIRLLAGAHLLREEGDQWININLLKGIGTFDDRQGSTGLFAEVEWKPTSTLQIDGAIRLQRDRQDRTGTIAGFGSPVSLDHRGRYEAVLPRVSAAWTPRPALTIGAMIQQGYNPGGTTLLLTGEVDSFEAERLWSSELFARGRLFRGAMRWSVNLFHNAFRDAQRPQSFEIETPNLPPLTQSRLDNAPRAWSRGLEAEVDWKIASTLSVRAGLGLLKTRIVETLSPNDPIRGREFQRAPHLSGTAGIDWKPVAPFQLSLTGRGRSGYYSDDQNAPERRVKAGFIVDAKARYDWGKPYVAAYVRNAFDRFQLNAYFSNTLATAEDPREFGLEVGTDF